jgi:predicted  nucleic acid-binding Zn-ribbon protein
MSEFRMIAREGMPLLADEFGPSDDELIEPPGWNADEAKRRLFAKLDQPLPVSVTPTVLGKSPHVSKTSAVAGWVGLAASLTLAVGFGGYELGMHRTNAMPLTPSPLTAKVQSLTNEKTALDRRLDAENTSLASLEKQTSERQNEIDKLQRQLDDSQSQLSATTAARATSDQQLQATATDRDNLAAKLQAAQQAYQAVQIELSNMKLQRQQDQLHYASLEVEANDLTRQLHDAESRVNDDDRYLASDRDIRELMGARQLYIADVVDVDQNGERRKPYGRVFYTKGKSLIFYAFDLDQQPGLRRASIFQAWAREGSDKAQPVSLGIFYVDSEANRRWALKASDPQVLAQINSVFVTVEPKGGSERPTGKPLLYAYLKTEAPNHP